MTKQEFFATLMNNQVMPLATIDVMHEGRSMYSLYVRQRNAPNCTLSRHCDGSKTGQDMHGKYLDWMHEYAVKFDELVDAAHAEALEENTRFDNLGFRFENFYNWNPDTQRRIANDAHREALEMDKAYDEANAEPEHIGRGMRHASLYADPRTVQWCGRAMRLPYCRCTMERPVFEPLILDLRQLYGEALRDYWPFGTEEDRAELIEEHHALALAMNVQRDFYRLPLILRLVAVRVDHMRALRMNRQRDFFLMPLYQRVSEIEWAHFEALAMDQHHDALAAIIRRNIEAMPAIIRMTFELK